MGGVFDLLGGHDDDDQTDQSRDDGIAAIDMVSLPPPQLTIMRLILRQREMTYPQLCAAIEAMSEADRLSQAELDEALGVLLQQRWLILVDDNQPATFKVNLRRKSAGRLDSFAPRRQTGQAPARGLWDALGLDSRPDQKKPPAPDDDNS